MSLFDIELEKRRKERDALAKRLEFSKNEAAIAKMNNKIKFLENTKKQFAAMPKDDDGSNDANQNTTKVPVSFLSSFSLKVDLNKSVGDASTSNTMINTNKYSANHPKIDLQRRPVQLEGYRKICFD